MVDRGQVFLYIFNNYFGKDFDKAAELTGLKKRDFEAWAEGKRTPNRDTIDYLMHCAMVPSFKVIANFAPFDHTKAYQTQFKEIFGDYANRPGIYAFYDSLGRLLYVGKANSSLMREVDAAIKRDVHIALPEGVKRPERRAEITAYISAYFVGESVWDDLPKIVEALILRISKPLLNKNTGTIPKVEPPKDLD